jgi:hypothetical protein
MDDMIAPIITVLIPQQSENSGDASTVALWTGLVLSEHCNNQMLVIADRRRPSWAKVFRWLPVAQHLSNSVAAYSLHSGNAPDRFTTSHAIPNANPLNRISQYTLATSLSALAATVAHHRVARVEVLAATDLHGNVGFGSNSAKLWSSKTRPL